uniref:Protein phosphatase n=1 Tax=Tetraselmis sp. GSL018 TaxID=582737 RepID=A0A061RKG3_9CHLO
MRVQDYGSCSLPGTRYGSLNQDFCFVETVEGQLVKAYISAVLDGHGMLGEKCAKKAGRSICSSFRQLYQEQGCLKLREVQESLTLAFEEAHKKGQTLYSKPPSSYEYPKGSAACELYELSKVKGAWHYVCNQGATPLEFGTTCTACLLSGDELAVAHVGDSAAVLGFVDDENEDYAAERVTRSHTWTDRGEAGRVQGMRGVTVRWLPEGPRGAMAGPRDCDVAGSRAPHAVQLWGHPNPRGGGAPARAAALLPDHGQRRRLGPLLRRRSCPRRDGFRGQRKQRPGRGGGARVPRGGACQGQQWQWQCGQHHSRCVSDALLRKTPRIGLVVPKPFGQSDATCRCHPLPVSSIGPRAPNQR